MTGWNKGTLLRKKKYYLELLRNEKDPKKVSLLYETIKSIDFIIDKITPKKNSKQQNCEVSYRDIIVNDALFIKEFFEFTQFVHHFRDAEKSQFFDVTEDLSKIDTSRGKILTTTRDFYNSIKGPFKKQFKYLYLRADSIVNCRKLPQSVVNEYGKTYQIAHTNDIFIDVCYNNTLQDYCSSIHEFGHAISLLTNPNHLETSKFPLVEVDSIFFEMIGNDFVGKHLNLEKDSILNSAYIFNDMLGTAHLLSAKLDAFSALTPKELYNKGIVRRYICRNSIFDKSDVDDVIYTSLCDYSQYTISYLVAIELYMIYQDNPQFALDLLNRIILLDEQNSIDYFNKLKELGIHPGEHVNEYINIISERLDGVYGKKLQNR